jgi:cell division protein FtsA
VDLGADTTTVSVYFKNILRHLAVIPLGGNNITKDIATLQMEEADAERMKLKNASAYTDNSDIDNSVSLPIDQDRSIVSRDFINIVEGRIEEIIENAWFQVPNEYIDKLLGGIILTGGGANMKNIERAFRNHTHIEKIRVAKFVTTTINSNLPEITAHNGRLNTILGILEKGDMNCAGEEITGNLFDNGDAHENGPARIVRQPNEILGTGIVQTEEEKKQAEEEARRRREEEEEAERQRLAEEAAEARRIKRENSPWNRFLRSVKNFGGKIIEDETE